MPNWKKLERKLKGGVDLTRAEAARALGVWGGEPAVELLLAATNDQSWIVRRDVLAALAHLRAGDARAHFAEALNDDALEVRTAALTGLGAIRAGDAATTVASFVESEEPAMRAAAIRALGRLSETPLPAALLGHANDEETAVREAVMDAIAENGNPDSATTVLCGLRDREESVRYAAVWAALPQAWHRPQLLVDALGDSAETVAAAALDALAAALEHLPSDAYGPIPRLLVSAADREALVHISRAPVLALPERFESSWFDVVRFRAAEGDRAVIEDLKWVVAHETSVAALAIEALAKLNFDEASPRFRSLAADLWAPVAVRVAAQAALTRFGDRRAEQAFVRSLGARREDVRGYAAECSVWTNSDAVTEELRKRMPDGDALVALGWMRDQESHSAIANIVAERADRDQRADAVWALAAIDSASEVLSRLAAHEADAAVAEAAHRALWVNRHTAPRATAKPQAAAASP